jgi:hypothetical protein
LLRDGNAVSCAIEASGRSVTAMISRAALEQHFWLRSDANANHMLRTFTDGRHRIVAVAERLALRSGAAEVKLDSADFRR